MEHSLSLADLVGFFGTASYLLSYILLQKRVGFAQTVSYPAINLAAALFCIVSLMFSFNMSAFISQCIWVLVSSYGICKAYKNKKKSAEDNKKSLPIYERLFCI